MCVSTYDSSVTLHSSLTLLERTPKATTQLSKKSENNRNKTKCHVECSNMNEISAKHLHPNRNLLHKALWRSPVRSTGLCLFRFWKPPQICYIIFPENMSQCLSILSEKVFPYVQSESHFFKIYLLLPIFISCTTVKSLAPSIACASHRCWGLLLSPPKPSLLQAEESQFLPVKASAPVSLPSW